MPDLLIADWTVDIVSEPMALDGGRTALGEAAIDNIEIYLPPDPSFLELGGLAATFSHELGHMLLARHDKSVSKASNNLIHFASNELAATNDLTYFLKKLRIFGTWRIPFIQLLIYNLPKLLMDEASIMDMIAAGNAPKGANSYW